MQVCQLPDIFWPDGAVSIATDVYPNPILFWLVGPVFFEKTHSSMIVGQLKDVRHCTPGEIQAWYQKQSIMANAGVTCAVRQLHKQELQQEKLENIQQNAVLDQRQKKEGATVTTAQRLHWEVSGNFC